MIVCGKQSEVFIESPIESILNLNLLAENEH